tara:strand:- start:10797 stop:12170 length:1374 start_codon:yes stop_codon:yes gene_type:complete
MSLRVALFPGNIIYTDSLLSYSTQIKVLFSNKQLLKKWEKFIDTEHCDIDQDISIDYNSPLNQTGSLAYPDIVRYVMNDSSTYHILRRKISAKSLYEIDLYAERVIYRCIDQLLRHKIDCVIHHNTPHEVVSYIFSKVAEFFKIPIYVIKQSPIPWRVYIQKEAFNAKLAERKEKAVREADYELMKSFLSKKTHDYNEAIPDYEKERLVRSKGRFWDWKKEIGIALNRKKNPIKSIYSLYLKYKLYHFFLSQTSGMEKWSSKFVTFYLHYQPERTTLPEGGVYNQQFVAIRLLRLLLPSEISIIVREHPSTFRNSFSLSTRSELFYSRIASLDNVHWCPLELDSFKVLDGSLFISTITGTVATEASMRGKCTLYFGDADYQGMHGTYPIQDVLDNQNLLPQIIDQKLNPKTEEVMASYDSFYDNSFGSKPMNTDRLNWEGSLSAGSEALCSLLREKR